MYLLRRKELMRRCTYFGASFFEMKNFKIQKERQLHDSSLIYLQNVVAGLYEFFELSKEVKPNWDSIYNKHRKIQYFLFFVKYRTLLISLIRLFSVGIWSPDVASPM